MDPVLSLRQLWLMLWHRFDLGRGPAKKKKNTASKITQPTVFFVFFFLSYYHLVRSFIFSFGLKLQELNEKDKENMARHSVATYPDAWC